MPFAEFVARLVKIIEADPVLDEAVLPSMWKRLYDLGVPDGTGLRFEADALSDRLLGPDRAGTVAVRLAAALNAAFAPGAEAEAPATGRRRAALPDAEPEPEPEPAPAPDPVPAPAPAEAPSGPPMWSVPPEPVSAPAPTSAPAPSAPVPSAPPVAEDGTLDPDRWDLPLYDYSREDAADPLPSVSVSPLRAGGHRYTWPDPGEGEVFRVTTSDVEPPFDPEDARQAALTTQAHAEDAEPLTSALRFITVWGYEVLDPTLRILGQARRVAEGIYIAPVSGWNLQHDRREQAVFARWDPPEFPAQVTGTVRTARIPLGEVPGRFLRSQTWLSAQYAIPNSGRGFQDTDLEPGQRHTYIAAVEVQVEGMTRLSAPVVEDVTPIADPDRIEDLRLEAVTMDGAEQLRLSWTQRRGTRVTFYRSRHAPQQDAVMRGLIPANLLPQADLTPDLRVPNIPHPTGAVSASGREQWVLEGLRWDESTDWDTIHITPVTDIDGESVMIGTPVQRRRAGRVESITVVQRMNWQLVTFAWPGDAISVELRIASLQAETVPDTGPDLTVEKSEYERNGGFRIEQGLPAEGCRLFLTAVTLYEGRRIPSDPSVAAVEPLWRFGYGLRWPGAGDAAGQGLRARAAEMMRHTIVEIQVSAIGEGAPDHEAPALVLVHRADRLPLHANDGQRVPILLERPSGQTPPETTNAILGPTSGQVSAFFDHQLHGAGWYRLMVDAEPSATLAQRTPLARRTALERYALADPPLHNLYRR